VVVAGRLLSLAHSSRRTAEACELGIDTLPEARRRGYALAATVVWSATIRAEGLTPIYSAFAENTASLRLAEAAGYRAFVRGLTLK
jgi:predicted GNAT family acetyltransferase